MGEMLKAFAAMLVSASVAAAGPASAQKHGGVLRLSGVSDDNQQLLRSCRLDGLFPQFRSRSQAVLGRRPLQPR